MSLSCLSSSFSALGAASLVRIKIKPHTDTNTHRRTQARRWRLNNTLMDVNSLYNTGNLTGRLSIIEEMMQWLAAASPGRMTLTNSSATLKLLSLGELCHNWVPPIDGSKEALPHFHGGGRGAAFNTFDHFCSAARLLRCQIVNGGSSET